MLCHVKRVGGDEKEVEASVLLSAAIISYTWNVGLCNILLKTETEISFECGILLTIPTCNFSI